MTDTNKPIHDLPTLSQNLRPLGIFALNRQLREILGELSKRHQKLLAPDRLSLTPVVFNKQNRTFHFSAVQGNGWDLGDDSISKLLECLKKLYCYEKQIKSEMGALSSQYPYSDAVETLCRRIKAYSSSTQLQLGSDRLEFIEALHTIYFGLGTPRSHYLPGILYNRLSESSSPGREVIKWFSSSFAKLVNGEAPIYPGKFYRRESTPLSDNEANYRQESDREAIVLQFIRKFHSEGQLLLNRHFETGPVLLLPVWDTWIDGEGFGGLWAVLICTFAGEEPDEGIKVKERFEQEVAPILLPRLETISSALFNAGVAAISSDHLAPPYNLPEHFVRALTHVQDWERVKAYCGNSVEFCYSRRVDNKRQEWWRCEKPPCRYCTSGTRQLSWKNHNVTLWDRRYVPELTEEDISQYQGYTFEFDFPRTSQVPSDPESRLRFDRTVLRQQMSVLGVLAPKVRAQRYALRRAVSGIMGRNMSHNIGSHVLARYASEIKRDQAIGGGEAEDQRSDLLQYLQRRMDFLADVATSERAFWFQSLALEEQLGRLNWDKQKERFSDLGQQAESVLLRFITGKENLNATVDYKSKTDVYFASPAGEVGVHALYVILENIIRNSARHGCAQGSFVELEVSFCEQDQNNDLLKMEIVDPHSPVFKVTLTLVEPLEKTAKVNVIYTKPTGPGAKSIRDSEGKHAEVFSVAAGGDCPELARHTEGPIPVAADVTRNSVVLAFDRPLDPDSTPAKEAFCVSAAGESVEVSTVTIAKRLDERINQIMKEPILTADGEAKAENWGIREMQICAHYLRGFSLLDLESPPDEDTAVLEAGCDEGKLKYTIYVQRAKRMAVVCKPNTNLPDEKKLKRHGVEIIESTDSDWSAIGAKVGGHEYLVIESDGTGLPDNPCDHAKASLPVRRLKLSGKEIEALVKNAGQGGSKWMEPLHKRWAEEIRDKRDAWRDRKLFGVSICSGHRALPNPRRSWPCKANTPDDGLIFAKKGESSKGESSKGESSNASLAPLPDTANDWFKRLDSREKTGVVAAAWIDHANANHFLIEDAGSGLSGDNVKDNLGPLWISAEAARSGDPHTRFLTNAYNVHEAAPKELEWEILAAAVSRVAVLDERVQTAGREDSSVHTIRRHDLWRYMGVWTPLTNDCDLNRPDFDNCQVFLKKPPERCDQYPIDFLVVHLTILERLAKDRDETLRCTLDSLVAGTEAANAEVVVVTGRGVPAVARSASGDDGSALEGVRYLPISALLEYLVERSSKLGLMRTLWSAAVPALTNG